MTSGGEFRITHVCSTTTVAACGNITLWMWHLAPSDVALAAVRRTVAQLARSYPEGTGVLHVVPNPDGKLPNEEQRRKIAETRTENAHSVRASAVLFEGDGIRASLIRGIVTAIMLASSNKTPMTVFRDAPTAIAWLRARLGADVDPVALADAVTRIKTTATTAADAGSGAAS